MLRSAGGRLGSLFGPVGALSQVPFSINDLHDATTPYAGKTLNERLKTQRGGRTMAETYRDAFRGTQPPTTPQDMAAGRTLSDPYAGLWPQPPQSVASPAAPTAPQQRPAAPMQSSQGYDEMGFLPQVPQSLQPLQTMTVKPAPKVGDAYAQPAMQAQAQAPQAPPNATGPDLIQKFMAMLHAAGPATPDYDRHALNGW